METTLNRSVAYIGIGSNLGDRVAYLGAAIDATKNLGDLIAVSSVYETEPFGVDDDQPMYLNMTIAIRTELSSKLLLSRLLDIERRNGRVRNQPNESRTLDIDLLILGDELRDDPELVLPHPRMHERAFVMLPLAEIAPDLVHPTLGLSTSEIASRLSDQGVKCLGDIDSLPREPSF